MTRATNEFWRVDLPVNRATDNKKIFEISTRSLKIATLQVPEETIAKRNTPETILAIWVGSTLIPD